MKHMIGIDVGGTTVTAGLLDPGGRLLGKIGAAAEKSHGADGLLQQLSRLAARLLLGADVSPSELGGVGVGVPGFIDRDRGTVTAANLPLRDTPVAKQLQQLIGAPVVVQNDVRMIVYGESMYGAGAGAGDVLGITLGTGIASAFVSGGRLHEGAGHLAGEIGHITFSDIPYVCGCGMKGCLETVVSATGIARQARDGIASGVATKLSDRFGPDRLGQLTAKDVFLACQDGDAFARVLFRRTAEWLSQALVPAVALLSPDVILIGGGVASAGEHLFGPLHAAVAARVHPFYRERLRIVPPKLGEDAGVYGSAAYARQVLFG